MNPISYLDKVYVLDKSQVSVEEINGTVSMKFPFSNVKTSPAPTFIQRYPYLI
jgi:hypothetical protein